LKLRKGNDDYPFHLKAVLSNQPELTIQEIMEPNKKASSYLFSGGMNDIDNLPSLGKILIVGGDEAETTSIEKILNECLYRTSVAFNINQVIEKLNDTWYNLILIELDSIDALEDHLAKYIREIEPDIPIIGLGNHASGPCLDVTYLKKPLTFELIRNIFPQLVSEKEVKVGRKALKGIVIGVCAGVLLWLLFIWILI